MNDYIFFYPMIISKGPRCKNLASYYRILGRYLDIRLELKIMVDHDDSFLEIMLPDNHKRDTLTTDAIDIRGFFIRNHQALKVKPNISSSSISIDICQLKQNDHIIFMGQIPVVCDMD